MTTAPDAADGVRLGPDECRRCLERLRPWIIDAEGGGWKWRLLLARARQTGYFPRRLHKALFKSGPLRRPYFIGTQGDGTRFLGDCRDEYSFWRAFRPRAGRPYVEFALSRIGDGDYVDVGTNLAADAAAVAAALPPRSRVYAFEPDPETADRAAATLALNAARNAALFRCAAGESDGELKFHRAPGYSDIASGTRPDVDPDDIPWVETAVPCFRLDTLLPAGSIGRVGFLKIDTEGHDLQVLTGAQGLIARDRPDLLFEYNYRVAPRLGWTIADALGLIRHLAPYRFRLLDEDAMLADLPVNLDDINSKNGYINVFGRAD